MFHFLESKVDPPVNCPKNLEGAFTERVAWALVLVDVAEQKLNAVGNPLEADILGRTLVAEAGKHVRVLKCTFQPRLSRPKLQKRPAS